MAHIWGKNHTRYMAPFYHLSIFERQGHFRSANLLEWYLTFSLTYNLVDIALEFSGTIFTGVSLG